MLAFLRAMRRDGKPIRWIAARLGITPGRAAAKAAALRLIVWQPNAKPAADPNELEPLGGLREIAGEGLCRFIAAATDEPWRMCARPCPDGSAWCPYHRARVYVLNAPEPSKKKKPGHDAIGEDGW